jgi:sarcosine oxidase
VVTDAGAYEGDQIVLACGSWIPKFVSGDLAETFRPSRQVLYWFEIDERAKEFLPARCPVFIWEFGPGTWDYLYGFPSLDGATVKLAAEQYAETADPDTVDRDVNAAETEAMFERYVRRLFPTLGSRCVKSTVCLYTVTPDWGFVLDRDPRAREVFIASPCSGHGFKHSAAVGEAVAETLIAGQSTLDIAPFGLARFD